MGFSAQEQGQLDGFYRGRAHALDGIPRVDIEKLGLSVVGPDYDKAYRDAYMDGYDVGLDDLNMILSAASKQPEANRSIGRDDGLVPDEHEYQDELEWDR